MYPLKAPDFFTSSLGVIFEEVIPICKVSVDRISRVLFALIVAGMDDCSRHTAKHGLDYV